MSKIQIMDGFNQLQLSRDERISRACYFIVLAGLLIDVFLSLLSALKICTEACAAGHSYTLYGFSFEAVGITFLLCMAALHLYSTHSFILKTIVVLALAAAVGAEVLFIYAQKYLIGNWCPICLGIAAAIAVAFIASITSLYYNNAIARSQGQKGDVMQKFIFSTGVFTLMAFGFFFADMGFAKFNPLEAAEKSVKEEIAFGNMQSPMEVYVFTDWECPPCRKIEPIIVNGREAIMKEAKLIFVDLPLHTESLDFTPYNLSFMIHSKPQYFKLRDGLTELSLDDKSPTEQQIEALAKKEGTKYIQMNFAKISAATNYFETVAKQFDVDSTPTVVVVNANNKKGKKLLGLNEITLQNILSTIEALK